MIRKISLMAILAVAMAVAACSGIKATDYDSAKCEDIARVFAQSRNLEDISKQYWRDIYKQYMAINLELNDRMEQLISQPWSDQKGVEIDQLLDSKLVKQCETFSKYTQVLTIDGFPSAAYFSDKEIAALKEITEKTASSILTLQYQAGL